MDKCPKCNSDLKINYYEQQTAAGDYINEYKIITCSNENCDHKKEECVGGHCDESWNLDE